MKVDPFFAGSSGIYCIRNCIDGKVYVGRTLDLARRCQQYKYDFQHARHSQLNDYLYSAMRKHGFENFEFSPLEFCAPKDLEAREIAWMDRLRSCDRRYGYNLRRDSDGAMVVHPETSEKIRANLKRQWAEGIRDGHSEKLKAAWLRNPERREQQSEWFRSYRTKYRYEVVSPDGSVRSVDYRGLKEIGMSHAVGSMSRRNADFCKCKGHKVRRIRWDEDL